MRTKVIKAEIAALEERLHLNRERMGVASRGELERSAAVQNNLALILLGGFGAGLAAGFVSKEVHSPVKKILPFVLGAFTAE